jgi:hypothetical protein
MRRTAGVNLFTLTLMLAIGPLVAPAARAQVSDAGNHLFTVEAPAPQANARFGAVLLARDLDGDGIDDPVIGAPEYDDLVSAPRA